MPQIQISFWLGQTQVSFEVCEEFGQFSLHVLFFVLNLNNSNQKENFLLMLNRFASQQPERDSYYLWAILVNFPPFIYHYFHTSISFTRATHAPEVVLFLRSLCLFRLSFISHSSKFLPFLANLPCLRRQLQQTFVPFDSTLWLLP